MSYKRGYSEGYEDGVKDVHLSAVQEEDWEPIGSRDPGDIGYEYTPGYEDDVYISVTVEEWTDGSESKPITEWTQVVGEVVGGFDDLAVKLEDGATLKPSKWTWSREDEEDFTDGTASTFSAAANAAGVA